MQDIMIRIQTDDFEAWKEQHYLHAADRARYGITGPAYRDLDNPGAALEFCSVAGTAPVAAAARSGGLAPVGAGAEAVHLHPRDSSGAESLAPGEVAAAVAAAR